MPNWLRSSSAMSAHDLPRQLSSIYFATAGGNVLCFFWPAPGFAWNLWFAYRLLSWPYVITIPNRSRISPRIHSIEPSPDLFPINSITCGLYVLRFPIPAPFLLHVIFHLLQTSSQRSVLLG